MKYNNLRIVLDVIRVAPHIEGRGLKWETETLIYGCRRRPSHRGAWIEIYRNCADVVIDGVAPHIEGRGLKYESSRFRLQAYLSPLT